MTITEIKQRFNDQDGSTDYLIGFKFYKGLGLTVKNLNAAFTQFLKAAKKGHQDGLGMLKNMIAHGEGDIEYLASDISWLKRLGDKDDLLARSLMELLLQLPTAPENLKSELRLYLKNKKPMLDLLKEKAAAGDPYAQFMSRQIDPLSAGQKIDSSIVENLKRAADQGDATAAYHLATMYVKGVMIEKNLSIAFKYATIAANKEHPDALFLLGKMYRRGEGVAQDIRKGFDYMLEAAKRNLAAAQYDLGAMFVNGFQVTRDFHEGLVWIKKSANQGYGDALAILGIFAREGLDDYGYAIDPDYKKAFDFFKESAEKGSWAGKYNLAQFYQSGLTGENNVAKANEFFGEILKSNDEGSFIFKALMYEAGIGTHKDLIEAKKYYEKSTDPADFLSKRGLARVNEKLLKQAEKKRLEKEQAEAVSSSVSKGKEKTVEEVPEKKVQSSKTKKAREKRKAWAKATTSTSKAAEEPESEEEPEAIKDIDIAGEVLKRELNAKFTYGDKSFISEVDTGNNKIVIKNPYDTSVVTIDAYHNGPITQKELKSLKKFIYDDRVRAWFGSKAELLKKYTEEQIERHRFAERVDEVVQLYGTKAVFMKQDGTLEKNRILIGDIKTQDNRVLKGTIEFAYYKDKHKGNVVYHRFLHPHSKIRAQPHFCS